MAKKCSSSTSRCRLRRCITVSSCVSVIHLLLAIRSVQSLYGHKDMFPSNDEYDFNILDPESVFGSPLGGFSRATRSRLAALPLRLPSVVESASTAATTDDDDDDPNSALHYMEISDASGRPFVCRVYHDDEIDASSLSNSMFDPPIMATTTAVSNNNDDAVNKALRDVDTFGHNSKKKTVAGVSDGDGGITTTKPSDVISGIMDVEKRLAQLTDVCAQLHKGWWSYEWCYAQKVIQFHIHVEESESVGTTFRLQDITRLGEKSNRDISLISGDVDNGNNKKHNHVPNPLAQEAKEIARVHDLYKDGDLCPETNLPRTTHVMLICCSHRVLDLHKSGVLKKGKPLSSNIASFVSLEEDPDQVCIYNVTICTPLLCEQPTSSRSDVANETGSKNRRLKPKTSQESIRDVIEANLDNVCLQSSFGGWWMYELCHGRHIRQFHETIVLDPRTGRSHRTAESEHKLGYYLADDLEDFLDEEEWKYVVNKTDDHLGFGSETGGMPHGGNGAYFVQEYRGGDVCDHKDVTGAAIKAGNVGEGRVERAASVHFSCGPRVEIVQVNEDSTCHYVMEVTIPDLCDHPLFKAAVSKKRIVKCLPVNP